MENRNEELTYGRILAFWLPLAATWFMMSVEGPFLAAIIARMAEPKYNLAAYGVSFSIALIVEAPIIMIMAAATTLVRDRQSFLQLRRYTYTLNGLITLIMVAVVLPPVFFFIALDLIHLPAEAARPAHLACVLLLPWPAAIGYRRFYQGILIRNNQTRYVAYGTVVRVISMALAAVFGFRFTGLDGASVASVALSAGVIAEALASRLMAAGVVAEVRLMEGDPARALTHRAITAFYLPLALTTILALGVRPMITFFVGQSRMPLESLAVLPVVHSLVFLFICFGLSFQEVVITLMGDRFENYRRLRDFALALGLITVAALGLISFTPLSWVWFRDLSGLSENLAGFALWPTRIMTLIPALWVLVCFQRGVLMNARTTAPITRATAAQVLAIVIALFVLIRYLDLVGVVAASLALLIGSLASPAYLHLPFRRALKKTA